MEFQRICRSTKRSYEVGKTEMIDGELHTLELPGGKPVPARYLYDFVCDVSQFIDIDKGTNGESYREERRQNSDPNLSNDRTSYLPSQSDWTKVRGAGRPEILYQYKCTDNRVQYSGLRQRLKRSEVIRIEDGTILLSADGYPIRDFQNLPLAICSKGMLGYQMVAICRLNAVGYPDFLDRMAPALKSYKGKWVDGRMTKEAFNQSRLRARNEMRVLPWPEVKDNAKTAFQLAIEEDIDPLDKVNNTTRNLVDLSPARIQLLEKISKGTKFNRAAAENSMMRRG